MTSLKNSETMSPEEVNMALEEAFGLTPRWTLKKRGLYYREGAAGYTSNIEEAWAITEAEADQHVYPHDEPVTKHRLPVPNYAGSLDKIRALVLRLLYRGTELDESYRDALKDLCLNAWIQGENPLPFPEYATALQCARALLSVVPEAAKVPSPASKTPISDHATSDCICHSCEERDVVPRKISVGLEETVAALQAQVDYARRLGLIIGVGTSSDCPEGRLQHIFEEGSALGRIFQEWTRSLGGEAALNQALQERDHLAFALENLATASCGNPLLLERYEREVRELAAEALTILKPNSRLHSTEKRMADRVVELETALQEATLQLEEQAKEINRAKDEAAKQFNRVQNLSRKPGRLVDPDALCLKILGIRDQDQSGDVIRVCNEILALPEFWLPQPTDEPNTPD